FCSVSQQDNVISSITTRRLAAGETLTIVAGFKPGYFRPATAAEKLQEALPTLLKVILPPLLIGGYAWRRWRKYGRDPAGRGTIIPHYDAPADLLPAETGVVADFRVDQRDITATLIDLAIRGYLKIIEDKKVKKLRRDTLEYSLELTNADYAGL